MLRLKISVFCVGGKSRENQSNWVVWMLKGVSEEADFKAVLIALPQQGQPDFAWAGSEELKQADPHTLLAAYTDPDCSLEQLSSGYFPVYCVVTCPWHILSELILAHGSTKKCYDLENLLFQGILEPRQPPLPFEQICQFLSELDKRAEDSKTFNSSMLHEGKQLEKENPKASKQHNLILYLS